MSNKANIPSARNSSKAHKDKESSKKSNSQTRLKIIVRRLPPNLPEPVFWQSVQAWVTDDTVSWKVFYPGKSRKKVDKENIPSRAYLLFKDEGHLASFSKAYDGHIFRDKQGNESYAIVEFAPNPKVASEKRKVDPRHATIQQDEDYLSFLASLQDPPERPEVDMEALLASAVPPEEPKITPLLAALREQKEQKAVIQDKKILTNDAKAARKAAASSSIATAKQQEAIPEPSAAKKGKKGKGKDSGTLFPQTTPSSGKGGRNRGNQATTSTHPTPASPSKSKKAVPQSGSSTEHPPRKERENEKERSRPVIGLGSRHLKAALSGAGVQVQSTNLSASSSSTSNPPPGTGNDTQSSLSPLSSISTSATIVSSQVVGPSKSSGGTDLPLPDPRGRGAGREKHTHESKDGSKEGASQGGGGGGRGGREKRNRPPSGVGRGVDAPPLRILTRQDPPPPGIAVNEPSGIIQESGNARGGGGGRGRGGRRERGS